VLVVVSVAVLACFALAPFALHERAGTGTVADTAADLPGQVREASNGLRGLGYSCSDAVATADTVTRACSRVRNLSSSRVDLVAATDTGLVLAVRASAEQEWRDRAQAHRDILTVISRAIGLPPAEQEQVVAAATAAAAESVFDLGWGTAVVHTGTGQPGPASTFRAAGATAAAPQTSRTTLAVPVDALAAAARAHGYTCVTPQVQTIRSCQRTVDGYGDDLWLQGTDTFTTTVDLSVTSDYRTATRARWLEVMDETLAWVDTAQTRSVRAWLTGSAGAPGAHSYVDGLRVSFFVRVDEYTTETFGGISAECAPTVDDIAACAP
jgi:hypothetical protein